MKIKSKLSFINNKSIEYSTENKWPKAMFLFLRQLSKLKSLVKIKK
jgi:hypothetical protein